MKRLLVTALALVLITAPTSSNATAAITIPTFDISEVTEDSSVTINAVNFPAGDTFTVRMGAIGTLGIGGIVAGSQDSGTGSFSATYNIPPELAGSALIAIRLQSPTSGYYSYNWFANSSEPIPDPAPSIPVVDPAPEPPAPVTWGYPAGGANTGPMITITAVSQGTTVTLDAKNFTTNDTYKVLIGAFGTLGVGGTEVATQDTDGTGTFSATYNIPAGLAGASRIAIRLQSPTSSYYSYNWFWNNNHP